MTDDVVDFSDDLRVPRIDSTSNGYPIDTADVVRAGVTFKKQRVEAHGFIRDVDSSEYTHIEGHHNMPHFVDYRTAIGLGKVTGHRVFRATGRREALSAIVTGDDIWNGTATSLVYPNQTTGEQFSFISTSANDTAAGTGVQQIEIHGIRLGGIEGHETITLNGNVAAVNSTITDWIFAQYQHTSRIPTDAIGTVANGDITCYRTGDAARVYLVIKAGGNVSLNAQRMIPTDYNFYCEYIMATATSQKPISVRLRATCDFEGVLTPGIFIFNEVFELDGSGIYMNQNIPRKFPPGCIIKATAYSTQAGGTAAVSYGGWLE